MTDLTQQLAELQARIEALVRGADPAVLNELEDEARRLLAAARNTPQEPEARRLFSRLAQRAAAVSSEAPAEPEVGAVRGLHGLALRARQALRQERDLVDLLVEVDPPDVLVHRVGEAVEVRDDVGAASDLRVDATRGLEQPVGMRGCAPGSGSMHEVGDQPGRLLHDGQDVAYLVGCGGSDLADELGFPPPGRLHPRRRRRG